MLFFYHIFMERIVSFILSREELDNFHSYLEERYPGKYKFDNSMNMGIYDSEGKKVAAYSSIGLAFHKGAPEIIPKEFTLEKILNEFMGRDSPSASPQSPGPSDSGA